MNGGYYINGKIGRELYSELTNRILEIIDNAKSYVKICSFLIQDPTIKKKLEQRAKEIAIFFLTNTYDSNYDDVKPFNNHIPYAKELHQRGVHIRMLKDIHAKFVLADGNTGLLMSTNMTTPSLNGSGENGVDLELKDVQSLESIFDELFVKADVIAVFENDMQNIKKRQTLKVAQNISSYISDSNIKLTLKGSGDKSPHNCLSDCDDTSLYKEIISIVDSANEYLYIMTYQFIIRNRLNRDFIPAVNRAIQRGVKVIIYSREPNNKGALNGEQKIVGLGCDYFKDGTTHSKFVLNEKAGVIFTANIDEDHGMFSGFEVGVILSEKQRVRAIEHVKNLINNN